MKRTPSLYSRTKTPRLYNVWRSMKKRCLLTTHDYYYRYGGRGIRICDEWMDFPTFARWAYENGYDENAPKGKCTLDRIDNNGNYEPSNCRWVSAKEQQHNKCDNILVEFEGEIKTIAGWRDYFGLNKTQLSYMYHLKRYGRPIHEYLKIVKYNPEKLKDIHIPIIERLDDGSFRKAVQT